MCSHDFVDPRARADWGYTEVRKGIGRRGIVLKHEICLQKGPVPCRPMPLLVCAALRYSPALTCL